MFSPITYGSNILSVAPEVKNILIEKHFILKLNLGVYK